MLPEEGIIKMTCKGKCIRHRAQKPPPAISRYDAGQKRCQACELFYKMGRSILSLLRLSIKNKATELEL